MLGQVRPTLNYYYARRTNYKLHAELWHPANNGPAPLHDWNFVRYI